MKRTREKRRKAKSLSPEHAFCEEPGRPQFWGEINWKYNRPDRRGKNVSPPEKPPDLEPRATRQTTRYRKMRRRFLWCHPLCTRCKVYGRVTAAREVDHIKPAKSHPELFWDPDNWQGLCRPCHENKTALENMSPSQRAWRERNDRVYGSFKFH